MDQIKEQELAFKTKIKNVDLKRMENEQVLHGLFQHLIVLKTAYNYLPVDDLEATLVECKEKCNAFFNENEGFKATIHYFLNNEYCTQDDADQSTLNNLIADIEKNIEDLKNVE